MEREAERRFSDFEYFLQRFVRELNDLSRDGWVVLVEGKRDAAALRTLGYLGTTVTVSAAARRGGLDMGGARKVVVLTDLDAEGGRLSSRYGRMLSRAGARASLQERRRLLAASKGVFRHIENLSRFRAALTE